MTYTGPLRCQIPPEGIRDDIRWLEIRAGDGGYYLFQFKDINLPCKWDSFFSDDDFAELIADCHATWGISPDRWEPIRTVQ